MTYRLLDNVLLSPRCWTEVCSDPTRFADWLASILSVFKITPTVSGLCSGSKLWYREFYRLREPTSQTSFLGRRSGVALDDLCGRT